MAHSPLCIELAITAIAYNNGDTLDADPDFPRDRLTPETEEEALEWLANGNTSCRLGCED